MDSRNRFKGLPNRNAKTTLGFQKAISHPQGNSRERKDRAAHCTQGCGDGHHTPVSPLSAVTNGVAGQLSQRILLLLEVFPKPI